MIACLPAADPSPGRTAQNSEHKGEHADGGGVGHRAPGACARRRGSAGETSQPPARTRRFARRNGEAEWLRHGGGAPPARTRSVTGAIEVAIANVSVRPGRAARGAEGLFDDDRGGAECRCGGNPFDPNRGPGRARPATTISAGAPSTTAFAKVGDPVRPRQRRRPGSVVDRDAGAAGLRPPAWPPSRCRRGASGLRDRAAQRGRCPGRRPSGLQSWC